jgi:hypothetical protein
MAQETKEQQAFVDRKNRERDREVSERGAAGAGVAKKGHGGMDTRNKEGPSDKKGI